MTFDLVPVSLFGQTVSALEVRPRDGGGLEFEIAHATRPGDRLLDLLTVTRRAVRGGHLVLLSGLRVHEARRLSDDKPYTFVWSVGDCAGLLLENPASARRLIVGDRAAVRFVASCPEPPLPPEVIIESPPVCYDYRDLARLWADEEQMLREQAADGFRWLKMIALGRALGEAHSKGVLHGDTNEGNLIYDASSDKVGWIDLGDQRILYGPAPAPECATDLLPLMNDCNSWDWYNIKRGYLHSWPDGDRVFDLIESGDRSGWRQAHRREDYRLTLDLLNDALRLVEPDDTAQLASLLDRASLVLPETRRLHARAGGAIRSDRAGRRASPSRAELVHPEPGPAPQQHRAC